MSRPVAVIAISLLLTGVAAMAEDRDPDTSRDVLVTLQNSATSGFTTGIRAPYRARKRYAVSPDVRRHALELAKEYSLDELERWPIKSLSVFCIVYRVAADADRQHVIERLQADPRVESAQALHRFETLTSARAGYDDTYSSMQRGLDLMQVPDAHRHTRGRGVRVAIIDSRADAAHEDLQGRVKKVRQLESRGRRRDADHGTAIASVIGATANNALGIVGIAPEASLEVYSACWAASPGTNAVCDSFTLAKALDEVAASAPQVVNLSLAGPHDPLLARLLDEVGRAGSVMVAARFHGSGNGHGFPANHADVISVGSSDRRRAASPASLQGRMHGGILAPGEQILVALPGNGYDFRSGESLAAAHVSGIVALLLSALPDLKSTVIREILQESGRHSLSPSPPVSACLALRAAGIDASCP